MGRVKLAIKKIENPSACHVTYSKRKNGIIKKATELSILCGIDVGVIMFSPAGRLTSYAGSGRVEDVFLRYFNIPPKLRGGNILISVILGMGKFSTATELRAQNTGAWPVPDEENIVQKLMRMKVDGELIDQIAKREALQKELAEAKEQVNAAKQKLRYYMPDVQNIKTFTQAELHERIILTALKRLEIIRENLTSTMQYSSQQAEIIKVPSMEIENADTMSQDSAESNQGSPRDDEPKGEEIIESSSSQPNGTTIAAAEKEKMVTEGI